jgi:hypothetical protein
MFRAVLAALAALTLAACASVAPNALDANTRQAMFVKDVAVAWSFDDGKNAAKDTYVAGKTDLEARLQSAVETAFQTSPAGSDAVRFDIDVKRYNRVGAAMGNIVGGSNMVVADVKVVRIADGKQLGVYKDVSGIFASNGGVLGAIVQAATKPDVVGIMANNFAQNLRTRFNAKA